ncbi:MAG: hypothetical protein KF800_15950 [Lysobacter sp.]|nr:hypothetical protein [Lysobacter sp.]
MNVDDLVKRLREEFPGIEVFAQDAVVVIPSPSPVIGKIEIEADTHGWIVSIGDLTHGHFDHFTPGLDRNAMLVEAAHEVMMFLGDVFAERIEFFNDEQSSGWRRADVPMPRAIRWSRA